MSQTQSPAKVAAVVAFYMVAALVMVFVNKAVLISSPDIPFLFLFVQLVGAVILLHLASFLSPKITIPVLNFHTAKSLTPVVSINIIGLVFNTLCLRDVEASYFQIARGMLLPLTIGLTSILSRKNPSVRVMVCAAVVTCGFLLGVAPFPTVPTASKPGVVSLLYGFLSALAIAIHSVLIKSSLPHCNDSAIELAYWTNLGSALMLAPFIVLHGDISRYMLLLEDPSWNKSMFVWGCAVTTFFGFLLCIAGLLSIKVTSPVTHMFSSAARSSLQTLLGVWIFGDLLTIDRGLSILTIASGSVLYTWVKHVESNQTKKDVEGVQLQLAEDQKRLLIEDLEDEDGK